MSVEPEYHPPRPTEAEPQRQDPLAERDHRGVEASAAEKAQRERTPDRTTTERADEPGNGIEPDGTA